MAPARPATLAGKCRITFNRNNDHRYAKRCNHKPGTKLHLNAPIWLQFHPKFQFVPVEWMQRNGIINLKRRKTAFEAFL